MLGRDELIASEIVSFGPFRLTAGRLTGSIAHEVNQPLAAIVTNGEAWAMPTPRTAERPSDQNSAKEEKARRRGAHRASLSKLGAGLEGGAPVSLRINADLPNRHLELKDDHRAKTTRASR